MLINIISFSSLILSILSLVIHYAYSRKNMKITKYDKVTSLFHEIDIRILENPETRDYFYKNLELKDNDSIILKNKVYTISELILDSFEWISHYLETSGKTDKLSWNNYMINVYNSSPEIRKFHSKNIEWHPYFQKMKEKLPNKELLILTTDKINFPDLNSENLSIIKTCEKNNICPTLLSWHDFNPELKYSSPILIRTVWDYSEHIEEFREFLLKLKKSSNVVINNVDTILWNIDKTYLFQLEKKGIKIVPAKYYPKGCEIKVIEKSVLKPTIGLGSQKALLLNENESITVDYDSILTTFRESIYEGEKSIIVIQGKAKLQINKYPNNNDWRVQPQYGGKYKVMDKIDDDAAKFAEIVYKTVHSIYPNKNFIYTRVDMLIFNQQYELLEFEAIEPSLYGDLSTKATQALVDSISDLHY